MTTTTKNFLIALTIATSSLAFFNCGGEKSTVKTGDAETVDSSAQAAEAVSFKADATKSEVTWRGSKKSGDEHYGTISLKEGNLLIKDGQITGGTYVIDMNNFAVLDLKDEEKNKKLAAHLKDADFFETEKYPTATFTIVSVAPYKDGDIGEIPADEAKYYTEKPTHTITGNFMMKGVEKSIIIPAKVNISGDKVEAEAKFNIDRTLWGVNYNSDESIQNKFINKAVNIGLKIIAVK